MSESPDILSTTRQVTAALGGIRTVAKLTGRKYSAAANWPVFGRFPANTYVTINAALMAIGKSAPASLWGMKPSKQDDAA